jgi:hypothetical protein
MSMLTKHCTKISWTGYIVHAFEILKWELHLELWDHISSRDLFALPPPVVLSFNLLLHIAIWRGIYPLSPRSYFLQSQFLISQKKIHVSVQLNCGVKVGQSAPGGVLKTGLRAYSAFFCDINNQGQGLWWASAADVETKYWLGVSQNLAATIGPGRDKPLSRCYYN